MQWKDRVYFPIYEPTTGSNACSTGKALLHAYDSKCGSIIANFPVKVGTGEIVYKKVSERDLSLILFLNDDYEGGDLVFLDQNIKIKPEPGLLVTFPSTYNYPHKVEPVTKGTRYAMVWWATILGFPTVKDEDEEFKRKYG